MRDWIPTGVYMDTVWNDDRPLSFGMIFLSECTGSDQNLPVDVFT